METKKVKITSVTPKDRYSLVGKQGDMHTESLAIGERLIVAIDDRYLSTSAIQDIKETGTEIEVKTRNSIYKLEYLKED